MPRSRPLLGLAFAALLLGAAELGCRLLPAPQAAPVRAIRLVPHPTRIWTLGETTQTVNGSPVYRLDQHGMRAPLKEGHDAAPLVLTVGDSSIFGDGLAAGETLHDQLQSALVRAGRPARVRTVAVPGYSTVQSRIVLDEIGWAMQPDLLILANMWSDCSQDLWRDEEMLALMNGPAARLERLLKGSALFGALRGGVNRALGRPTSWHIGWPRPGDTGQRRVPVARYAELLGEVLDQAAARNVGVVFLTLADRNAAASQQDAPSCGPYVDIQRQLARSRRLPIVDAREAYRGSGLPVDHLLWDELHPAVPGVQALTRGLVSVLERAGWPQKRLVPGPAGPLTVPPDPDDGRGQPHPASVQREIATQ